jgi:lipopolysaccharide export system permease protein
MDILERYILRTAVSAFLLCLIALTAVIWITSALRELDLVTGKGQSILMFLYFTLLSIPALIMIIAPLALFIAILYTLNKLNGDSELIVMNAAGVPPLRILRPFLMLTVAVALLVAAITIKVMPDSFRTLRNLVAKIRADVVTQFVQEGKFVSLDQGITFHYREKGPGGSLRGIMFQDRRNPNLVTTYLAERGRIVEVDDQPYFVLEKGSLQRQDKNRSEAALVYFERYALDMDQLSDNKGPIGYKPRERSTIELMNPDTSDAYVKEQIGRFRAELHERFSQPLYAFATLGIAFAALGTARTTRQGRGSAIAAAGLAMLALRVAGFWASSMAVRTAGGVMLMYLVPVLATVIAGLTIWWGQDRPAALVRLVGALDGLYRQSGLAARVARFDPAEIMAQINAFRMRRS